MKISIKIVCIAFGTVLLNGCSKEEIPYYYTENNAIRFEGSAKKGYDEDTETLYKSYSFAKNPLDEYAIYDIPLYLIGNAMDKDVSVSYVIDTDQTDAPEGSYEIEEAMIPANSYTGYIRVKIYNPSGEDTYNLHLTLRSSTGLDLGPSEYLQASLAWNNTLPAPASSNYYRTYNMLIKGTSNFASSSLSCYSPNALKTIVAAFGWNDWDDQSAHPEFSMYPSTYFGYPYLPHYALVYSEGTYTSFAAKLGEYIENYNATHDTPLLHDAGALIGEPIEARKY